MAICGLNTSVLEKFHCQIFTNIISNKNANLFSGFSFEKVNKIKQAIFSMILFTDMSFHNQLIEDFSKINFSNVSENSLNEEDKKVIN